MSRSFCIDLKGYSLHRTIGGDKKTLKTPLDRSDLISCLESMGYYKLSEISFNRRRFGMAPGFEEAMSQSTLGIPASANVEITRVGTEGTFFHLSFTY